jgi:ribosome maturation factor RimP
MLIGCVVGCRSLQEIQNYQKELGDPDVHVEKSRIFGVTVEDGLKYSHFCVPFFVGPAGGRSNVSLVVPPHVRAEIEQACIAAGVTLIDLVVRGQHRQLKLDVVIDAIDGITHEHCRSVSRNIDERVDEKLSEDEFVDRLRSIDVSSPGADTPVAFLWQLKKHGGRTVQVETTDGSVIQGSLMDVTDEHLIVQPSEQKKNRNQSVPPVTIPQEHVKSARVVISFH